MPKRISYTLPTGQHICELLAQGKSLVAICQELKLGYRTVMQWLERHEDFAHMYAHAREQQADFYADEIIKIADGHTQPDDRRIKVEARKWVAAKLKPRKYGDRLHQEHSGPDGKPLPAANNTVIVTDLQTKPLDELIRLFTDQIKTT